MHGMMEFLTLFGLVSLAALTVAGIVVAIRGRQKAAFARLSTQERRRRRQRRPG